MSIALSQHVIGRVDNFRQGRGGMWITGALVLIPVLYLLWHDSYNPLVGIMAMGAIMMAWTANQTIGLAAMFGFVLTLGDLRRIIAMLTGSSGLDPLLLVVPVFTIFLALPLLMRLKVSDLLSKAMLGLIAVMALEVFNPLQGPIAVGLAGGLYWIIPILWFWVGRQFASDKMIFILLYRIFLPLGVLDAALGVFQTYFGYLPWEEAWARPQVGQYILKGGQVRPFGFSTSAIEYSLVIILPIVLTAAAIYSGRRLYILLLPILLPALFLGSSRGAIVRIVFAIAMIWAVRGQGGGKRWLLRLFFALFGGLALIVYSASSVAPDQELTKISSKSSSAQLASAHVTQGLAHPLDDKYSTGGIHASMIGMGILRGFTLPTGTGIGSVTLGAGKFGGDSAISGSTEADISDAFVTMGFVGGLLYVFIIYKVCALALQYVRTGPPTLSLAYIGLLSCMLGSWVPPCYPIGPLIWLCIGALVKNGQQARVAMAHSNERTLQPVHDQRAVAV